MSNIIDYAVDYTNITNPTTILSGAFSVHMDTLTLTIANIITNDASYKLAH